MFTDAKEHQEHKNRWYWIWNLHKVNT